MSHSRCSFEQCPLQLTGTSGEHRERRIRETAVLMLSFSRLLAPESTHTVPDNSPRAPCPKQPTVPTIAHLFVKSKRRQSSHGWQKLAWLAQLLPNPRTLEPRPNSPTPTTHDGDDANLAEWTLGCSRKAMTPPSFLFRQLGNVRVVWPGSRCCRHSFGFRCRSFRRT